MNKDQDKVLLTVIIISFIFILFILIRFKVQKGNKASIVYEKAKYILALFYSIIGIFLFIYSGITILKHTTFFKNTEGVFWFFYFITCFVIWNVPIALVENIYERYKVCKHGIRGGETKGKCKECVEERERIKAEREQIKTERLQIQQKKYIRFTRGFRSNKRYIPKINSLSESPIEEKFWNALKEYISVEVFRLFVQQYCVDKYRIDIAIPSKKFAIELDGHEFHKTKKQRTHDAERERHLQKLGWLVIRFTGTEIHRDIYRCINDLIVLCELRLNDKNAISKDVYTEKEAKKVDEIQIAEVYSEKKTKKVDNIEKIEYPREYPAKIFFPEAMQYYYKKEFTNAIKSFTDCINHNPKHCYSYLYRGYSYYHSNCFSEAIKDFEAAIAFNYDLDNELRTYINDARKYLTKTPPAL